MLKIVSTTYEMEHNEFLYRFKEQTGRGVTIVRVKKDNPLWSHGVLCQMCITSTKEWKPLSLVLLQDQTEFESLALAVEFVGTI